MGRKAPTEAWEKNVRTGPGGGKFYKPPAKGKFTIKITGRLFESQYKGRAINVIPTANGEWSTNSFAILRAIKQFKEEHGDYLNHSFTFSSNGKAGLERRYEFVSAR